MVRYIFGIASDDYSHHYGGKFILFKDVEDTTNNWRLSGCSPGMAISEHSYLMIWGTDPVPPVFVIKDIESISEERVCNVVAKSSFIQGMNCRVINLVVLPVIDRAQNITGGIMETATHTPNVSR